IGSGERFRQIVINLVAAAELGIVLENAAEPWNRSGVPVHAEIMYAHEQFCLAQAIARNPPILADLWRERARRARAAIEEHLKFLERRHGLRLIALGRAHLHEMAHRELVLRVVGTRIQREERDELAVFVGRQHQRFSGLLAEVGVTEAKLGIGPERTPGVVVDDLLEVFAGVGPLLFLERLGPPIEEEAIWVRGVRRQGVLLASARRREAEREARRHDE